MIDLPRVTIYTDGACINNPGPGGWAAIILENGSERTMFNGCRDTTNNRMELTAALEALKALKKPSSIVLYTDSEYLRRGVTEWLEGWKARSWKRKGGKLANIDLWQALDKELSRHQISWRWVKGHNGDLFNEKADRLAFRAIPRK